MKTRSQEQAENMQRQGNLATLNEDGSRRWIRPRPSLGRTWRGRKAVAFLLIATFASLPWVRINGKPPLLLDIAHREFTVLGTTFFATDTLLLALTMVTIFLSVFAVTAIFGRVWCGWACPQTVYLEFVYRPIERFFDGTPGRTGKTLFQRLGIAPLAKYITYFILSFLLANIFLSYFVGTDNLVLWVTRSPTDHPVGFTLVAFVTLLMMFDFAFFREQMCMVACPYGRFQSVLLDRNSLIVGYDSIRGEPRGKSTREDIQLPVIEGARKHGDCVDCGLCVSTCPTGIDIRAGLQLECIHCAQCIDACDAVMTKLSRPTGLIRYGSQNEFAGGKRRFWRPRLVWYGALLTLLISLTTLWVVTREPADVLLLNQTGRTFTLESDGRISNHVRIKLTNRSELPQRFELTSTNPDVHLNVVTDPQLGLQVEPRKGLTVPVIISAPPQLFVRGRAITMIEVTSADGGFSRHLKVTLMGPGTTPTPKPVTDTPK